MGTGFFCLHGQEEILGEKDKNEKYFVAYPDVFADVLNSLIYHGKEMVREENLMPAPTESLYVGKEGGLKNQFRDFGMYEMSQGKIRTLYALENQTGIDSKMILRKAGYDGVMYRNQYEGKTGEVYPVITLVLNWNQKPWHGANSIREMIDMDAYPKESRRYIDNNEMYVYDMCSLDETTRKYFKSDMRIVLDYLADWHSLEKTTQKIVHPEALLRMLYALSGDDRYEKMIEQQMEREAKNGKEAITMCEMLTKYWDGGVAEGMERGTAQIVLKMLDKGVSAKEISRMTEIKLEEIERIAKKKF